MKESRGDLRRERAVTGPKPMLRGWFHAVAAVASAVLTVVLCWVSRADFPRLLSLLVFGLSMLELYTVSAIYHMGTWREKSHRVLRALDHSNIFVLIAGSYTPICFIVLTGWLRVTILGVVWLLALTGIALSVFSLRWPRWVGSLIYIAMGWTAVLALPAFLQAIGVVAVSLLAFAGLLYTVGAVVYATRWPNPFPRVLGFHEVFHLFVIAGSAAIVAVIAIWVVPFPRS